MYYIKDRPILPGYYWFKTEHVEKVVKVIGPDEDDECKQYNSPSNLFVECNDGSIFPIEVFDGLWGDESIEVPSDIKES